MLSRSNGNGSKARITKEVTVTEEFVMARVKQNGG